MTVKSNNSNEKIFLEKMLDEVNTAIDGASALVPWFNLTLFLTKFFQFLCMYMIVKSGFVVAACVVVYHIIQVHNGRPSSQSNVSKSKKITIELLYELGVSFVLEYSWMIIVYFINFPTFVLSTFVYVCLDSTFNTPKYLDEKLILENMDEEKLTSMLQRLGTQVPLWLNTPDHERVLWLNKIIKQLWPHMGAYIEDVIENMIDDFKIKLTIESLFHGNEAPKISSVTVREKPDNNKIFLDVNLIYGGDFSGCIKYKGIGFVEITYIKIEAAVQIELSNFVGHVPFVGKIVVNMEKQPTITPTLKKAAALLKKKIVSPIENAIKKCFPVTHVLVADAVENLPESCPLSPN